jgi:uncharacterized phage protein (TIGR02218 family)
MAQNPSAQFKANLLKSPTTLARLFEVERVDGVFRRFTDLDEDITDTDLFKSSAAMTIRAIQTSKGDIEQNTDFQVNFADEIDEFSDIDLLSGVYRGAKIRSWIVDYTDIAAGRMSILNGLMSRISVTDKEFGVFSVKGLLSRLDRFIGEIYQSTCRANLGDARCKKDLTAFTRTFTINTVGTVNQLNLTHSGAAELDDYFSYGVLKFDSPSLNAGVPMELIVDTLDVGNDRNVILAADLPFPVLAGDTGTIVAGCNKTIDHCLNKFDNIVNRRAEDFAPNRGTLSI